MSKQQIGKNLSNQNIKHHQNISNGDKVKKLKGQLEKQMKGN